MKTSYHSHTKWCKHAKGEIEDYVLAAINADFELFAICDHVFDDNHPFGPRGSFKDYPQYLAQIKEVEAKYQDKIKLIRSMEAEYYPEMMETYRKMKKEDNFSIWILGQHESKDHLIDYFAPGDADNKLISYTNDVIEGIETGFFDILAHPDLMIMHYDKVNELFMSCMARIFEACEKNKVIVEINANGIRGNKGYPNLEVFELSKKYDLKYIISSDANNPKCLYDDAVVKAEEFAEKLGLKIESII